MPVAEKEEIGKSKDKLEEDKAVWTNKLARLIKAGQYNEAVVHHEDRDQ